MHKKLIRFDWAVKRLLRNKANFVVLEGFLSELLYEDIRIEQILESESNPLYDDDKYDRLDIQDLLLDLRKKTVFTSKYEVPRRNPSAGRRVFSPKMEHLEARPGKLQGLENRRMATDPRPDKLRHIGQVRLIVCGLADLPSSWKNHTHLRSRYSTIKFPNTLLIKPL